MTVYINLKETEPKKVEKIKELTGYVLDRVNGTENMKDKERAKMDARIMAKLKSGKKLSQKEKEYLRKTNPVLYAHVIRVQRMAEMIEKQLNHAESKEEANRMISSAMSGISQNDPDREFMMAAVNRISAEFHKSGAYQMLPNTTDEADKDKKQSKKKGVSDDEEEEDMEGLAWKNWSPLSEVYDNLPSFSEEA